MSEDFLKTIIGAVVAKAITALPALGWPIVNQIFSLVVSKIIGLAYDEIKTGVNHIIIDAEAKARTEAYNTAIEELKKSLESQKNVEEISQEAA